MTFVNSARAREDPLSRRGVDVTRRLERVGDGRSMTIADGRVNKMYWIDYDGKMRGYDTIGWAGERRHHCKARAWAGGGADEGKRRQRCVLNDALVHVVRRTEDETDESDDDGHGGIDEEGFERRRRFVGGPMRDGRRASCDSEAFKRRW